MSFPSIISLGVLRPLCHPSHVTKTSTMLSGARRAGDNHQHRNFLQTASRRHSVRPSAPVPNANVVAIKTHSRRQHTHKAECVTKRRRRRLDERTYNCGRHLMQDCYRFSCCCQWCIQLQAAVFVCGKIQSGAVYSSEHQSFKWTLSVYMLQTQRARDLFHAAQCTTEQQFPERVVFLRFATCYFFAFFSRP